MPQDEYFDSEEFLEILDTYESSVEDGTVPYLDIDDYSDIADYYMNADKPSDAINCVEKGLSIYPGEQQLLLVKSGALIYLHRFNEADEIVRSVTIENNDKLYQEAQLQYAYYGNTDRAEEMFTDWIRGEREFAANEEEDDIQREEYVRDSYIHVITSFIELSHDHSYDEELVKRWVELYIVTFSPLGGYDSDFILADTVRCECIYDMVVKVYSCLLETDPYISHGWTVLAAAQFTCNQIDDALDSAEFALAIDPNDVDSILTKAHCLLSKECYAEAIPVFEDYIQRTHESSQYLALASCYAEAGRTKEALRSLQRAEMFYNKYTSDKEYYASASFEMAELYFTLGKLDMARHHIDRAIKNAPDQVEYNLLNATLMLAEGNFLEALPQFIRYLETQEDVVGALLKVVARLIAFSLDSVALELLDIVERAPDIYEGIEQIYPYKALIYLRQKDYKLTSRYLNLGKEKCRDLTQWIFSDYIPQGMSLDRYCELMESRG